jgi:FtsH-binding integral membrane protein
VRRGYSSRHERDEQRLLPRGRRPARDAIWLATGIFVSIVNIFISLLNIFSSR